MNIAELIIGLVGGLGLFLYGMKVMSEGLRNIAGPKMRNILEALTKSRLNAALVGVGVTCLVQSSSATTVMVVGLVNSGLLVLRQAIGVIMGANIGTTITAILASLVAENPSAVSVAFAHLMFNIYGIAVFLPLQKIPIFLATKLANVASRNRWVPIVLVLAVFFIIPLLLIKITG